MKLPTSRNRSKNSREYMAEKRAERRANGFREVNVWVPEEDKDKIHEFAREAREQCDRPFDGDDK